MMILRSMCSVTALVVVAIIVLFAEFVILNNTGRCSVFIAFGGNHMSTTDEDKTPTTLPKRFHETWMVDSGDSTDAASLGKISQSSDIDVRGEWQRKQVEKFCQKYGDSHLKFIFPSQNETERAARYKLFRHLLFDDKRRLLFCFIPKVGCTNMRRFLFLSQGVISEKALKFSMTNFTQRKKLEGFFLQPGISKASFLNKSLSDEERLYKTKNYFKFTFVRNPLERLLSAFLDKISPPLTFKRDYLTNPEIYQRYIIERHRKEELKRWKESNGSFELRATFSEYVEWVLSVDPILIDEHYAPMLVNAQPCRIRYDFYGHFKTYSLDMAQVIKKLDANPAYFSHEGAHSAGNETRNLMRSYYSQLSGELKERLVEKYSKELDFYYHLYPNERGSHVHL